MNPGRVLFFLLILLLVVSCSEETKPGSKTTGPSASLSSAFEEIWKVVETPPDLDLADVSKRLKGGTASLSVPPVNRGPASPSIGTTEGFWVTDLEPVKRFRVEAALKHTTPHALWYVDTSLSVSDDALRSSAQEFEDKIYPVLVKTFAPNGAIDSAPITVLNTSFRGAAGYFSSRDMYPAFVHQFSNQRPMIYINARALSVGTRGYVNVISHEFQHYLHWLVDPNEESWINEGMAVFAEEVAGFASGLGGVLARDADVQLTDWGDEPSSNAPHYSAAYLFMRYLAQHFGGNSAVGALMAEPGDGPAGVDRFLEKSGFEERFIDVFAQWVVANFLDAQPRTPGRYAETPVKAAISGTVKAGESVSSTVRQFAAKYYQVAGVKPETVIRFSGSPSVKLLPNDAKSPSYQWWSNRGDFIDATLTREFDLTGVTSATLTFNLWYDLEEGWDYGYVVASVDGGSTWKVLEGRHTTKDDPVGNAFGPGYTGVSGGREAPLWVEERIDLTPYAGKQVLLRFEHITDEAVNHPGFGVDDIAIPEIGYSASAEDGDGGWARSGFVRTDNRLPQRYIVQTIAFLPGGQVKVTPFELDSIQEGELTAGSLGESIERLVLAVSGVAPVTTEVAPFTLSVR